MKKLCVTEVNQRVGGADSVETCFPEPTGLSLRVFEQGPDDLGHSGSNVHKVAG